MNNRLDKDIWGATEFGRGAEQLIVAKGQCSIAGIEVGTRGVPA
jgi:hypothetical protein